MFPLITACQVNYNFEYPQMAVVLFQHNSYSNGQKYMTLDDFFQIT